VVSVANWSILGREIADAVADRYNDVTEIRFDFNDNNAPAVGAEENAVVDEFVRHMRAWLQVELDTWRAANADGGS
jgi:hypothetical protein